MTQSEKSNVERWDELCARIQSEGGEAELRIECGSSTAWSGELRWTPNPNVSVGPDISLVFFTAGCADPDDAIGELLEQFAAAPPDVLRNVKEFHDGAPRWQ